MKRSPLIRQNLRYTEYYLKFGKTYLDISNAYLKCIQKVIWGVCEKNLYGIVLNVPSPQQLFLLPPSLTNHVTSVPTTMIKWATRLDKCGQKYKDTAPS